MFREVYYQHFRLNDISADPFSHPSEFLRTFSRQQDMDSRFSVLLFEICDLNHRTISIIIGKPLSTVRELLSAGRKALLSCFPGSLAMICMEPVLL